MYFIFNTNMNSSYIKNDLGLLDAGQEEKIWNQGSQENVESIFQWKFRLQKCEQQFHSSSIYVLMGNYQTTI